jgi:hypothetical protein
MTQSDQPIARVTRRMWLAGLAGGALAVPFVRRVTLTPARAQHDRVAATAAAISYVELDSWMLTAADAAVLARPAAR